MALVLDDILREAPPQLTARRVWVACSAGLDSTVLLDVLSRLGLRGLRVIHVHHGLQAAADGWQARCAADCARRGIAFEARRVQIAAHDARGPEAAARAARYTAFAEVLGPGDVLATAHHLDDQAETFLMRALRGSGPGGLAAMRACQPFAGGLLWRPLLRFARAELEAYAREHGLEGVDDPHNRELRYLRSWLRHELMPVLRARLPSAAAGLARSAALCAQTEELLAERAREDAALAARGAGLSVSALKALSAARRANLLRWWIARQNLPPMPHAIHAGFEALLHARADAEPRLAWPGAELRRYRDELLVMPPLPPEPQGAELVWDGCARLTLPPGCGTLSPPDAVCAPRALRVRFAAGGERFRPQSSAHRRSLKNLFQERGVPPWRRRRTPLVYEGAELRWVGGLGAQAGAEPFFAQLRWQPGVA